MDHTTGFRITMSFRVPHGSREHWLNTWTALGNLALDGYRCRSFELRSGDPECAVHTEWESDRDFHHFVRTSGMLWLHRASVHPGFIPDAVTRNSAAEAREAAPAGR